MALANVKTGDLLFVYPEEMLIMVVMTNGEGIRYIEPMNPQFDDNGNVTSKYIDISDLSGRTFLLGHITNISSVTNSH